MCLDPRHGVDREVREREQALDEATGVSFCATEAPEETGAC
jgi:hypothetical protein